MLQKSRSISSMSRYRMPRISLREKSLTSNNAKNRGSEPWAWPSSPLCPSLKRHRVRLLMILPLTFPNLILLIMLLHTLIRSAMKENQMRPAMSWLRKQKTRSYTN